MAAIENDASNFTLYKNIKKDVLKEVGRFVQGCSYRSKVSLEERTRTALYLIQTLPSTRSAVLEHFHILFDEAANNYIRHLEKDGSSQESSGQTLDNAIDDVYSVLIKFIKLNPEAWAPIISAWSIEILGQISSKYSSRRGVPHANSLNELLQLWMNCKATKTLMDIASECFASMIGLTSADACVDALLEASVKHSPHFDWVVAHIGSSFPTTIISRVLTCGLKDYCGHDTSQSSYTRENIPKMASVVGILSHLASRHGNDIKKALVTLFEDSLSSSSADLQIYAVPFLLHLASMSGLLLKVLTTEFVQSLTPVVLNKLCQQYRVWEQSRQDRGSLLSLLIHLVMQSEEGCLNVLQFLLNTGSPDRNIMTMETDSDLNPAVRTSCQIILEHLTLELQRIIHGKRTEPGTSIPLLLALKKHKDWLCQECLQSADRRRVWLSRLLSYIGIYCGEVTAAEILCQILVHAEPNQLETFIEIQQEIETCLPDVLHTSINLCINSLQGEGQHTTKETVHCLNNILALVKWEKNNKFWGRAKLTKCLQDHTEGLSLFLSSLSLDVALNIIHIVNAVDLKKDMRSASLMKIGTAMVSFIFRLLKSNDEQLLFQGVAGCKLFTKHITLLSVSRTILLRTLVTACLNEENRPLLGCSGSSTDSGSSFIEKPKPTLLSDNSRPAVARMMSQSHLSVFHAGVIGEGIKADRKRTCSLPMQQKTYNKQVLVDLIWLCCCGHDKNQPQIVAMETDSGDQLKTGALIYDSLKNLAQLLVEFVSPDVLYNTPYWPEEQTIMVTIERDLHIKKKFEENPILWNLMIVVSYDKSCILECACLLRSVMATLLTFWDGCREKVARNAPRHLETSCQLLDCFRKGEILPKPLCYIGELFSSLAPHEVYLLLSTVWRYLQDHPAQFEAESGRLVMSRILEPVYLESIKAVIHNNIDKLGDLYPRFVTT